MFDNKIVKNICWLSISEIIVRFLKFLVIIYVARRLGAEGYGEFAFALSFVSLFNTFFNFGLSDILTREFSKDNRREEEFFSILSLKSILSFITLLFIFSVSFLITKDNQIQKAIYILGLYLFVNSFSFTFFGFLKARQKMQYEAVAKVLQVLILIIIVFIFLNQVSILGLSLGYFISAFFAFLFIFLFFNCKILKVKMEVNVSTWKKFLAMSWPMALIGVFSSLYAQMDSVMMGCLGQIVQTGWYGAALKITAIAILPMFLITQGFFPALSNFLEKDKKKFNEIFNSFARIMIFMAFPLMLGGILLAPQIISFVFGGEYASSVLAFQILIIVTGIIFLYNPFSQLLIVFNKQNKFFWIVFWGAIINFILNLFLIQKYSLYGAAFATLATHIFVLCSLNHASSSLLVRKQFFISDLLASLICAILMYCILSMFLSLNVLVLILLGFLIYILLISIYLYAKNKCHHSSIQ